MPGASSVGVTGEIPPLLLLDSNLRKGRQCMVGSLTGAVASQSVTEAHKGYLSTVGNRAVCVKA